jgi:hypothetical protein
MSTYPKGERTGPLASLSEVALGHARSDYGPLPPKGDELVRLCRVAVARGLVSLKRNEVER